MMSLISNQHFAAILRINLVKLSMSNQSKEFYIFSPSPLSIILYFAKRVMAENQKCSQACIILPFKQSTHGFKQAPGFSAWENGRIFFHTDQFYISKDLERRENVYAIHNIILLLLSDSDSNCNSHKHFLPSISTHLVKALFHRLNITWMSQLKS